MNKQVILCILLASSLSFSAYAKKQAKTAHKAYVSINEAVLKTGEQKKIRKLLEREKAKIEKIILNKSNSFKKQADKIKENMAILSEREKAKQYEKLQKMQMSMEQFIKEKEMAFQKKETNLKNKFLDRMRVVIANVAKKEKVRVVHNKDTVLWIAPKLDLTNKVISAYKKKYK